MKIKDSLPTNRRGTRGTSLISQVQLSSKCTLSRNAMLVVVRGYDRIRRRSILRRGNPAVVAESFGTYVQKSVWFSELEVVV